jgi:hypothetical protein
MSVSKHQVTYTPTEAEVTLCGFKAAALGEDTARVALRPFYFIGTIFQYIYIMGRDSVVSIATRYGLDGPGIES